MAYCATIAWTSTAVLLAAASALADTGDATARSLGPTDNASATALQTDDVVPGSAEKQVPASTNLASAALKAEPTGTQFRVSVAPFYLFPHATQGSGYVEVLSETRFTAVTDTSTNVTTPSLSLSYNPFANQGHRARSIWKAAVAGTACEDRVEGAENAIDYLAGIRKNRGTGVVPHDFEADIKHLSEDKDALDKRKAEEEGAAQERQRTEKDLTDATKRLATADEQLRDAETALRILNATASVLPAGMRAGLQSEIAAFTNDKAAASDAVHAGTVAVDKSKAAYEAAVDAVAADQMVVTAAQETLKEHKEAADTHVKNVRALCLKEDTRAEFWSELHSGLVPQVTATVGIDAYPAGTGPNPLDKTGMSVAPLEPWGGVRTEASLLFRPYERLELEVYGQVRRLRASGVPYTQLATYEGGGVTVDTLAYTWLTREGRANNSDYQKSGALPGVVLGASGQVLACQGFANCASNQILGESVTPFVELKLANAAQFRVSVPLKWSTTTNLHDFSAAPTFSAASAFAGL